MKRIRNAAARVLLWAAALFFLFGFFAPLAAGIVNAGSLACLLFGAALLFLAAAPRAVAAVWRWWGQKRGRRLCRTVGVTLLSAGVGLCFLLSGVMLWSVADRPGDEPRTVIVLGAGLNGDRPSRMLADRLRTAAAYLESHPDSVCVVSGGQGTNEVATEAAVMRQYLLELGVDGTRIYEEDASRNTRENLLYSKALIDREGLPAAIITVTQEFHQYRAGEYAAQAGFADAAALSCASPWYLLPCYWVREWFAILALWLL